MWSQFKILPEQHLTHSKSMINSETEISLDKYVLQVNKILEAKLGLWSQNKHRKVAFVFPWTWIRTPSSSSKSPFTGAFISWQAPLCQTCLVSNLYKQAREWQMTQGTRNMNVSKVCRNILSFEIIWPWCSYTQRYAWGLNSSQYQLSTLKIKQVGSVERAKPLLTQSQKRGMKKSREYLLT